MRAREMSRHNDHLLREPREQMVAWENASAGTISGRVSCSGLDGYDGGHGGDSL